MVTQLDETRRLVDLLPAERLGAMPELLLFWGHRDPVSGRLSQWWPAPFSVNGVRYATAEHFMMAGNARLFGDDRALDEILSAPGPREAKAAGRRVRGFEENLWATTRYHLVVLANLAKFQQQPTLGDYLLSTGDHVLVEASPYDRVWGIGLPASAPEARRPSQWLGRNLLGFALMEVRDQLVERRP